MPFRLGTMELVIILIMIIVLFGVGRIGKLGAELGKGIRELRRGLSQDDEMPEEEKPKEAKKSEENEKS